MSELTLYSFEGCFRSLKAQIAGQYNGVTIRRPEFDLERDAKSQDFLRKSPMGKVPVLETADGCIFESNAIARYVARLRRDTELTGRSFFETVRLRSTGAHLWSSCGENVRVDPVPAWFL